MEISNEIEDKEDTTCIDTNRNELLKSFCSFRMDRSLRIIKQIQSRNSLPIRNFKTYTGRQLIIILLGDKMELWVVEIVNLEARAQSNSSEEIKTNLVIVI